MPPGRYLIVTADDFGFSHERNAGIVDAYDKNAIKSASILLNCTGTNEGASIAKEKRICTGIHLNLTEGKPIGREPYKTIVKLDGTFWGKQGLREELNANRISADEVRLEIESQIKRYKELFGQKPIYVDGHQHIHVHPGISKILAEVLQNEGIHVTRYPVEKGVSMKPWIKPESKNFYEQVIKDSEHSKPIFKKHGIRFADYFVGLSTMGANMNTQRLQSMILDAFMSEEKTTNAKENVNEVTCELMTHPGYATDRKYGGFCWGTDDFGQSDERSYEIDVLSSAEMMEFYKRENIKVVSHSVL